MDHSVYLNLLANIKLRLKNYKTTKTLFDDKSKETIEEQMQVYETLAAQITTLGGLLQSDSAENRKKILEESVVKDLIAIMGH